MSTDKALVSNTSAVFRHRSFCYRTCPYCQRAGEPESDATSWPAQKELCIEN